MATLLSTEDVAEITGLSEGRIRALAARGVIKGQKVRKTWAFTQKAVREFKALERLPWRPAKKAVA